METTTAAQINAAGAIAAGKAALSAALAYALYAVGRGTTPDHLRGASELFMDLGFLISPEGKVELDLIVHNRTHPERDLHNLAGEFWAGGNKRIQTKDRLSSEWGTFSTRNPHRTDYGFEIPVLSGGGGLSLAQWVFATPAVGEPISLRYRVRCRETPRQEGGWVVVNEGHRTRILPIGDTWDQPCLRHEYTRVRGTAAMP